MTGLFLTLAGAASADGQSARAALPPVGFRSGITEGPGVVPLGHVVVEGGVSSTRATGMTGGRAGEVVVHVPLHPRVEFRLRSSSYQWSRQGLQSREGLDDPGAGVLVRLHVPRGPGLSLSVVAATSVPVGARAWRAGDLQPTLKLVAGRPLPWGGAVMAGAGWHRLTTSSASIDQPFGSVWLSHTVRGPVGAYVEGALFGRDARASAATRIAHAGVTWRVSHRTHLDAHLGTHLRGAAMRSMGLGFMQRL